MDDHTVLDLSSMTLSNPMVSRAVMTLLIMEEPPSNNKSVFHLCWDIVTFLVEDILPPTSETPMITNCKRYVTSLMKRSSQYAGCYQVYGDVDHGCTTFLNAIHNLNSIRMDTHLTRLRLVTTVVGSDSNNSNILQFWRTPSNTFVPGFDSSTTLDLISRTDGLYCLVDVVEGVVSLIQRPEYITRYLRRKPPCVLVINKVDRCVLELQISLKDIEECSMRCITMFQDIQRKAGYEEHELVDPQNGTVIWCSGKYNFALSVPQVIKKN
eukprot:PhF_6_TR39103/c0_g1_i1/m.58517